MANDYKQYIRQLYDAWSRGDVELVLSSMTEDAEWYAPGTAPFSGHRHGREQIREYFNELQRWIRFDEFDVDDVVGNSDTVVVLGRERATVRETGHHFETQWAHAYTLRNGKIVAAHLYSDTLTVAAAFGESASERRAQTGPLGVTEPPYSGRETPE